LAQSRKESLEEVLHSSKTLQQHTLDKQNMSINQLATKIPSHIYISYWPNSKIVFFPFDENNEVIQFTWIFPHAYAIMNEAQYFQIDSSFEVFKPFVFSVPLTIINSDSFPLGLQISPSENCRHYMAFFKNLELSFGLTKFFENNFF
jgi:hypothetical protein